MDQEKVDAETVVVQICTGFRNASTRVGLILPSAPIRSNIHFTLLVLHADPACLIPNDNRIHRFPPGEMPCGCVALNTVPYRMDRATTDHPSFHRPTNEYLLCNLRSVRYPPLIPGDNLGPAECHGLLSFRSSGVLGSAMPKSPQR